MLNKKMQKPYLNILGNLKNKYNISLALLEAVKKELNDLVEKSAEKEDVDSVKSRTYVCELDFKACRNAYNKVKNNCKKAELKKFNRYSYRYA